MVSVHKPPSDHRHLARMCKSNYTWYHWIVSSEDQLHQFNIENMAYYFLRSQGVMYLTIRGTDDIWDWLYNIRAGSLRTKGIHEGTYLLHNKIWPKLREFVNDNWCPHDCNQLVVGGHSMGGMVALTILRALIIEENHPVRTAAVFGTPSPFSLLRGKKEARQDWTANLTRYVNGNDIVPRLLNWRGNYPVGKEVQIGKPGWRRFFKSIADHDMAEYVKSMGS